MSSRRNSFGSRPTSLSQQLPSGKYTDDSEIDLATRNDASLSILPELMRSVRKLLPQEFPLNMSVRQVEYIENRCERLAGTLFLTTFRLVFAPEKEPTENDFIISGNRYISEFDIPLASIYKIHVAPVDTRSGFKSFLNENQIQSETRTFTVITRDFRSVTFTKCSVTKSNTGNKHSPGSVTNMETYINALKRHSRFQSKEQLYPYLAIHQNSTDRATHDHTSSTLTSARSLEDMTKDFSLSSDERIKSYLTYYDWQDELQEASEQQWIVDRKKFNKHHIVQADGPYLRLTQNSGDEGPNDPIWHWTHTSEVVQDHLSRKQSSRRKHMLITVPGIGELANIEPPESPPAASTGSSSSSFRFRHLKMKLPKPLRSNVTDGPKLICSNESKTTTSGLPTKSEMVSDVGLRRATTDINLVSSSHYIYDQPFQRYNLAKFPCNLKRLQTSYEKLIEICLAIPDDDDDKWWTKLSTCKWLKYVSKTLHGAASLAKLLDYKNIELAGSDTDNNCLMSSLIQILLRPKCRTIKGFCELIVREWLIRGHKFRERFGQLLHDASGHHVQESPVFLLFLDCVHQLLLQNSSAFEFTEYLLLELYRNVCYCYHHTFVFNDVSERLYAISHCPKNLLVLSSFDFSLYLYPDACYLLRNDASVFHLQPTTASHQPIRSRIDTTVHYPPSASPRTMYHLERPNSIPVASGISIRSDSLVAFAEHFEYETIESPQSFSGNLHVDWRMINLALWSKCYCRYDQSYRPTLLEEQLSSDVTYLKEKIETVVRQSQQSITLDTHQQIGHANSWHPQALDTRV